MITRSSLAATLLLGSSLAFAQVCPPVSQGSVCLVPSRTSQATTYMTPSTMTTTTMVLPYSGAMTGVTPTTGMVTTTPMLVSMTPITGVSAMGVTPVCPANISSDTACLINQISALRTDVRSLQGTIRATALTSRGQQLISRMNQLMAEEMMFRQQIATNPNTPGAQAMALALTAQAETLSRELADFNRELSLIPVDQRPYLAQELTTFTTAYWDPAMNRFAEYRTQFAQSGTAYQPAFAANPWLQQWHTGYSTDLGNITVIPQQYAAVNWWSGMRVAGTVETFPGGTMVTPSGSVIYIPAGTILTPTMSTMGTTATMMPTTGTTMQ